jgi:hypothetical protein
MAVLILGFGRVALPRDRRSMAGPVLPRVAGFRSRAPALFHKLFAGS